MDEVEEQAPVQPELEENHHDIRESQDHEEEGKDSYERIASDAQGAETEEAAELAQEDIEEQAEALPTPPPKDGADDIRGQEPSTTPPVPTQSTEPGTPSQEGSTPTTAPDTPTGIPSRSRTDSQSTTATNATRSTIRSTRSSLVFVIQALESIAASKDAKKRKALADSTQRALSAIRSAQGDASQINPEVLFEPLNLATEASTVTVVTTALDCIGKLISYSYFSAPPPTPEPPPQQEDGAPPPPPPKQQPPLIERAIDTICECFQGEATPAEIEMQIIKSLLAAVLNDKIVVHGAGLLKSVRQMYNIFLLSKSSANQQIAQGTVSQMVGTVFERVKARLAAKAARANSSNSSLTAAATTNGEHDGNVNGTATPAAGDEIPADPEPETPVEKEQRMTLQTFETRKSFDDTRLTDAAPTTVTRATRSSHPTRRNISGHEAVPSITVQSNSNDSTSILSEDDEDDEIHIKDAFLVFRAMCKLSTKPLRVEEAVDVKSPGMRSKLLSLHILHTVLFNHPTVFTSPHATIKSSGSGEPTGFTQAIKQYLCLSLSRNGASSVQRVFEVSAEIFGLMLQHLRSQLKRELEVFLKEIYLAILDKRAAPAWQKQYIVHHIFSTHLASDPKVLVEIYLNYDCDRNALDNMFQRIVEHVARIAGQPVSANGLQQQAYQAHAAEKRELGSSGGGSGGADWRERGTLPPSLATANMGGSSAIQAMVADERFPQEYAMKMQALECLVEVLRSLVRWGQQGMASAAAENVLATGGEAEGRGSSEEFRESIDTRAGNEPLGTPTTAPDSASTGFPGMDTPPIAEDDPAELEKVKARKTALNNAIRQFNFKPKRGIKLLIADGFIPSSNPTDIGHFLISNERLNKKALGEFLGEGDEENIKIMHAYVDSMDFVRTRFVDALRRFLQAFRLPGEAQKIDRLMLKFAERYTSGNPNAFANADTAYVLGYSVIMLNTDQHSAQVKNRMTIEDFIKNNRGINDNANLPDEYLTGIYEEIREHEIVLDTERATEANLRGAVPQNASQGGGLASVVGNLGRDLQREAYAAASEEMSNRTEQLFRSLLRAQKRGVGSAGGVNGIGEKAGGKYLTASSFRHVGPMFEVTWMGFLTALSGSAQETSNLEAIRMCMEGQKLAVRIACLFDLQDPRQAFVGSLARSTNLYNLSEMKAKNVEALRVLLDVAFSEGNGLKESWRDILTCVSQLDRFQLISSGVEEGAVPDVMRTQTMTPTGTGRKSVQIPRRPTSRAPGSSGQYQPDIAEESKSADMIRIVDRIFTNTANLSGDAIVHFVRSLTQVSWQEIQSSGQSDSPRTYSLQKLVEISGYNMLRVRFEWTNIWQVLGQHFIDVGCHNNTHVVFFALNSLRQLSMRFMEIEELPGFKFQKDFLKPFELILGNASQVAVKDMVLRCLIQMIQARGDMIRSGWRTMFGVFTVAAKEPYESIVNLAFDNVTQVYSERFGVVISQGAFADLVVCLTEFSKNMKFQKKSLQAIETLRSSVPKMLRTPECPLSQKAIGEGVVMEKAQAEGLPKQPSRQTQEEQFWFPVLFAFHDVLMTGEDLEVRSRALNYLFETLTKYGRDFPRDFWDTLWRQLLYPIFMVLKDRKALNQDAINHEDLSVWLSTTLIQALRNMISLFTHFFESLEYMLDRFLDLLALCICQENDTLARIGSNCLQQLILQNVKKFSPVHWEKIVGAFVDLFARTEAKELFSAATSSAYERRESSFGNGVPETPKTASVLSSTPDGDGNALRINGLPQDSSAEVATVNVNGDNRPPSLRTETSNSLALSDETERSISPAANPPPQGSSAREDVAAGAPTKQTAVTPARRRYFNQIITKCVLQLLMIETVSELFNNDAVYASIPSTCLLRLMSLLKKSYHFAKRFNDDRDLRTRLFREGFMKQPPNLLKQESGSASVYVLILLRMYADTSAERAASRPETEAALIPLCSDIIASYVSLDEETQQRNIATWRPVVIDVLEGYNGFGEVEFAKHVDSFAPLAVGLMGREMGVELQRAVQGFWGRVCEVKLGVERGRLEMGVGVVSPRGGAGVFGGRRGSRVK